MSYRQHGIRVRHLPRGRGWRVTIYDPGTKTHWYSVGPDLSEVLDRAFAHAKPRILKHRLGA